MPAESWMLPCTLKALTGYSCPWCGFQRGVVHVLQGDLLESILYFPPLLPMLVMVSALALRLGYAKKTSLVALYGSFALVLITLIINFIIKNA